MEKAAELKEALALVKDAEENKGFVSGADNPLAEGGVGGAGTGAGAGAGAGDGDGDGGTNDAGNVGDNPQASGAEATAAGPKSLKLKSAPSKGITLRLDAKGVQEDYFGEVDTSLGYCMCSGHAVAGYLLHVLRYRYDTDDSLMDTETPLAAEQGEDTDEEVTDKPKLARALKLPYRPVWWLAFTVFRLAELSSRVLVFALLIAKVLTPVPMNPPP